MSTCQVHWIVVAQNSIPEFETQWTRLDEVGRGEVRRGEARWGEASRGKATWHHARARARDTRNRSSLTDNESLLEESSEYHRGYMSKFGDRTLRADRHADQKWVGPHDATVTMTATRLDASPRRILLGQRYRDKHQYARTETAYRYFSSKYRTRARQWEKLLGCPPETRSRATQRRSTWHTLGSVLGPRSRDSRWGRRNQKQGEGEVRDACTYIRYTILCDL